MADDDLGPTHLFHVESIHSLEGVVLSLEGELDIAGVDVVMVHAHRVAAELPRWVVLDLRALTFIDGTGVRALARAALEIGDRLVVYRGPPRVQGVFELIGALDALPFAPAPAARAVDNGNVEFVRRLWHAFRTGGAEAMARLVPSDVEWRPSVAGGRVLRGPEELHRFWAARTGSPIRVTEFRAVGDDVLVRCEYPTADGTPTVVWSLYEFSESVLERAETYESERGALAHAA
jgi:anti-anti-sigma factor